MFVRLTLWSIDFNVILRASLEQLQTEFDEKETAMKNEFESKLEEIKKKYSDEMNATRNDMIAKLKKDYGKAYASAKVYVAQR